VGPPADRLSVAEPGDETAAKRALRDLVLARLTAVSAVASASALLCFASFRSEVDTIPFMAWCHKCGIAVALPRIVGPHHMEAFAVTDPRRDLAPGRFGIPEPRAELPLVEPSSFDVVIVPGSAFDPAGGRMGYGGGFYDTFMARARPDACRIGICFDLQVVELVPREPHDLCVDLVITERRTIETGCRGAAPKS
jgi:5-formyltetrahydrofolate cyclo-ligase